VRTQATFTPEPGDRPQATLGGTDKSVPVIRMGDVTIQFRPSLPKHTVTYLTELRDQLSTLIADLMKTEAPE
jgi:hypothetical protein